MVRRVGLDANKYSAVESVRGDIGWSSFLERMINCPAATEPYLVLRY